MQRVSERRKYQRVKTELDVRYHLNGDSKVSKDIIIMNDNIGKSIDISASGMSLKMEEFPYIGDFVKLSFLIPNTFLIFKGEGKIVWISNVQDGRRCCTGVEFLRMSSDKYRELNYYIYNNIYREMV